MFPRPNMYGFGFQQQHPIFNGLIMQHQQQRMLLPSSGGLIQGNPVRFPHNGPPRFQLNGPPVGGSPRMMQMRPFLDSPGPNFQQRNRGKKRNSGNMKSPPDKRQKMRGDQNISSSSREVGTHISRQPDTDEKFIVPVSKGTEKITVAIWSYFLENQMSEEDLQKKLMLRKSLHSVLEAAFPNCRLFIVGSSMTGFATRTSDVDMCLMISEKDIDQKGHATMILTSILKALRNCSFMQSPQVIRAKVPILKFYDQISGVECDLNVNNTIGVRNTHLLRYYAYMDWRVRPLMLFIKNWARFHDINDASKKTISSYSLTLMLIHYLQVGVTPPVLPCLQKLRPDLFNSRSDVRKLSLRLEDAVDFTSQNGATLGELFMGFLNYYSNIFNFDSDVISVRLGKRLTRRDVMEFDNYNSWKFVCIEEPFERSNTARSVYDQFVFWRVRRVFQASFRTLESQRNVSSVFTRPF